MNSQKNKKNKKNKNDTINNCRDRKIPKRKNVSKLNIVKDREVSCM